MRQCPVCSRIFDDSCLACPHDEAGLLSPDPLLGKVLGESFRIDALLGKGGMGSVYRAMQLRLNRPVALKIVRIDQMLSDSSGERFRRECLTIARLKHPNIVTVHDFGLDPAAGAYLVMEHLDGRSLRGVLDARARLPLDEALGVFAQVCPAVQTAHDAGIVHRDLKPDNIFLEETSAGSVVKVLDFGIAKLHEDLLQAGNATLTAHGELVGTPAYMSPEQCEGLPVDFRADIYSLGCVFYEMLAGQPPFKSHSVPALLIKHLIDDPAPLSSHGVDVPEHVEQAIRRAMGKQKEDRFESALALAEELGCDIAPQTNSRARQPVKQSRTAPLVRETQKQKLPGPNNLPNPGNSFIGHNQLVADACQQLTTARMVTLTGPGGVGKTRTALVIARDLLDEFPDGVWFVNLGPVADPALLPGAVLKAAGVSEQPGRPILETLRSQLQISRTLLVLDNCEHLIDACALFVPALLDACGRLCVLATSREPLGTSAEIAVAVPPLELSGDTTDSPASVAQSAAARLFRDRARQAKPGFDLTDRTAPIVLSICRRLDGLPLAIELAAAKVKILAVDQILKRLDDRFALLTNPHRSGDARQQTLRAAIDWSYSLLDDDERDLLARVSIFAGSWPVEAVEAVCATGTAAASYDPLDVLYRLVTKSLVNTLDCDEEMRYSLLESIRSYAREKLAGSEIEQSVEAAFFGWLTLLGESLKQAHAGPNRSEWLKRIGAEHDNFRAALHRLLGQRREPETVLRLADALWRFWIARGYWSEGRNHLDAVLPFTEAGSPELRVSVLRGAGDLAYSQGDFAAARTYLERSLEASRGTADKRAAAHTLQRLGDTLNCLGDTERGLAMCRESVEISRELGDRFGLVLALTGLGNIALDNGDFVQAREYMAETLQLSRELSYTRGIAAALHNLGEIAERLGDLAEARRLLEECLTASRELGDVRLTAYPLHILGNVANDEGDGREAIRLIGEALVMHRDLRDKAGVARALENLANAFATRGRGHEALAMIGAASRIRAAIDLKRPPVEQAVVDAVLAAASPALTVDERDRAMRSGGAMDLEQAIAFALSLPPGNASSGAQSNET